MAIFLTMLWFSHLLTVIFDHPQWYAYELMAVVSAAHTEWVRISQSVSEYRALMCIDSCWRESWTLTREYRRLRAQRLQLWRKKLALSWCRISASFWKHWSMHLESTRYSLVLMLVGGCELEQVHFSLSLLVNRITQKLLMKSSWNVMEWLDIIQGLHG